MKNTILIFAAVAGLSFPVVSTAQYTIGGRVATATDFTITDMALLSQHNYTLGTARTAAMGGAFSSLGADLSSMVINPAGLGMYRSSEISFTPSVIVNKYSNSYHSNTSDMSGNKSTFSIGNLGGAFNVYESGRGALTSVTLGFGYNKLADFNYNSTIGIRGETYSIGDMFAYQLRGVDPASMNNDANPSPWNNYNIGIDQWGAVLGYKTYLIDPAGINSKGQPVYKTVIEGAATVNPYLHSESRGSAGEYSFAAGFNLSNIVYLGASIGIQDIYYEMTEEYEETYNNNTSPLNYMLYDQFVTVAGTGVNFKFGVVVRPTEGLRLSAAVHSPTFVNVDREYWGSMYTDISGELPGQSRTNYLTYTYRFNTPTRFISGASYTFGSYAILSADYERAWYNGIRMRDDDSHYNAAIKEDAKEFFKASDIFRVGLEVRPMPQFALRAGGGFYSSPVNGSDLHFSYPTATDMFTLSGGLGYRTGNFSLDLAYSFIKTDYTGYDLFYYDGPNNNDIPLQEPVAQSGWITPKSNRHNISLTMGFRF